MKIAVGTTNPAKIAAVENAASLWFASEKIEILAAATNSGVSDQPQSDEETLQGAISRAVAALKAQPEATLGVGLEGGLSQVGSEWFVMGWVTASDREGNIFSASTIRFPLLPKLADLILREGLELGEADDQVFGHANSKQKNGYIGILTKEHLTRTGIFHDALLSVFGRLELE